MTSPGDPALPRSPLPRYTAAAPLAVRLDAVRVLVPDGERPEVRELKLGLPSNSLDWEAGQSVGLVPPGLNIRGRPNPPRLYSIGSAGSGQGGDGTTLTLLVKRTLWRDEPAGPLRRGLCSNWLCDRQVGDELSLTGPVGATLTLPAESGVPWILIATGTGIAPFRAFLQARNALSAAERPAVWLVQGARSDSELLWYEELAALAAGDPRVVLRQALSRQDRAPDGSRMYVHQRMREDTARLRELIDVQRGVVYVCGLRGMERGVEAALGEILGRPDAADALYAEGRWRAEVY